MLRSPMGHKSSFLLYIGRPDHENDIAKNSVITARKRSLRRLCLYRCLSVHTGGGCAWLLRGGCAWLLGGGHVWFFPGGMHGFSWGGMHGCSWGDACFFPGGGACVGYDEIRSMSGRYASYWNAFLF